MAPQIDISIDKTVGEDIAPLEKIPVGIKCIQRLFEAAANLRNRCQFLL